jgi:hypothetical protein
MKRFLLGICLLAATGVCSAVDATSTWIDIIKACAPGQTIGKNVLFFGFSDDVGPGSVWRVADDKSLRIKFELSDAFPKKDDQDNMIKAGKLIKCSANAAHDWNLKFGLPFTMHADALSVNIGAILGSAKNVRVSITGTSTDLLKEVNWQKGFAGLLDNDPYLTTIKQTTGLLLAENVVKVVGLTATFSYDRDLSGDLQVQFKNKSISVGDPGATAASSGSAANSSSTSGTPAASSSASSASAATPKSNPSTATADASTASACPSAPADGVSPDAKPASGGGGLTLHADVKSSKEIVICADGPFYVLAGYSKIINATPVGVGPGARPRVILDPVTSAFRENTPVTSER